MAPGPAEMAQGPLLIGSIFGIALWGVLSTQIYVYFSTYKNDRRWMKCFVLLLFVADTFSLIFILVYLYSTLVVNFGNVPHLMKADWLFDASPALTGIVEGCTQFFFAWRVHVITRNRWIVALIVAFSLIAFLAGLGTAIAGYMVEEFADFVKFDIVVIVWLAASAVSDVCSAAALTHHLQKRKTGFSTTDDVIDRIIRVTVQTGGITAVCAVINLVLFIADTHIPGKTATYLIFLPPLAMLYTNSLMSSLNSRGGWMLSLGAKDELQTNNTIITNSRKDIISFKPPRPEVFVHVEQHEMYDVESQSASKHTYMEGNAGEEKS